MKDNYTGINYCDANVYLIYSLGRDTSGCLKGQYNIVYSLIRSYICIEWLEVKVFDWINVYVFIWWVFWGFFWYEIQHKKKEITVFSYTTTNWAVNLKNKQTIDANDSR